jgi:hypothetical protein
MGIGAAIGGPLGGLVGLGVGIAGMALGDALWDLCKGDDPDDPEEMCTPPLIDCLENPSQPSWNQDLYGPRKDCASCYSECVKQGGEWPSYKCPQ